MRHIEIAREFIGTPFHPHACIKGVGADCAGLVHHSLVQAGVIRPAQFLKCRYTSSSNDGEIIEPILFHQPELNGNKIVQASEYEIGDILIFNIGGKIRHCSIVTDQGHIHSAHHQGVVETAIVPTLSNRIARIYRVIYG